MCRKVSGDGRGKALVSRCSFEQNWVCSITPTSSLVLGTGCQAQAPYGGANVRRSQPALSSSSSSHRLFIMEKSKFSQTVQFQTIKSLL